MSLTDELAKLAELHQTEAISAEEFAKAKGALLSRESPSPEGGPKTPPELPERPKPSALNRGNLSFLISVTSLFVALIMAVKTLQPHPISFQKELRAESFFLQDPNGKLRGSFGIKDGRVELNFFDRHGKILGIFGTAVDQFTKEDYCSFAILDKDDKSSAILSLRPNEGPVLLFTKEKPGLSIGIENGFPHMTFWDGSKRRGQLSSSEGPIPGAAVSLFFFNQQGNLKYGINEDGAWKP